MLRHHCSRELHMLHLRTPSGTRPDLVGWLLLQFDSLDMLCPVGSISKESEASARKIKSAGNKASLKRSVPACMLQWPSKLLHPDVWLVCRPLLWLGVWTPRPSNSTLQSTKRSRRKGSGMAKAVGPDAAAELPCWKLCMIRGTIRMEQHP